MFGDLNDCYGRALQQEFAEANQLEQEMIETANSVGNCFDDEISCEYDEETDEYYLKEGWYEVIRNWDEYGSAVIGDFVTHWMPLPEPPKE